MTSMMLTETGLEIGVVIGLVSCLLLLVGAVIRSDKTAAIGMVGVLGYLSMLTAALWAVRA